MKADVSKASRFAREFGHFDDGCSGAARSVASAVGEEGSKKSSVRLRNMVELRTTLTVGERSVFPAPSAKRVARQSAQSSIGVPPGVSPVSPGAGFDLQSGRMLDPDPGWDRAGKPKLAENEEQPSLSRAWQRCGGHRDQNTGGTPYDTIGSASCLLNQDPSGCLTFLKCPNSRAKRPALLTAPEIFGLICLNLRRNTP